MQIKNARYNMVYPKISNLRRKAFDIEEQLKDYFHQITLIPIPDDAPEEIPRISTTSHHGHSQLNISLSNAQLATNYDEAYESDWSECLSYLRDRTNKVYATLENYIDHGYLFSGLTTEIIFNNESQGDPIELIKDKFLKLQSNLSPHDIEHKITFVIEERYYVNITFKNLRIYQGMTIPTSGIQKQQKDHHLLCILDVNDRYGFNYKENYTSSKKETEAIFEITESILRDKLKKMITEGVFDI